MIDRQHGVILTHVDDLADLENCVRSGGYDTVKIVTEWGLQRAWTDNDMVRVFDMVSNVIVRTGAGDGCPPCEKGNAQPEKHFPLVEKVIAQVRPWYDKEHSIFIEIGNEPNTCGTCLEKEGGDDQYFWEYRFHLREAIAECRKVFPEAKLIAPGLNMDVGTAHRFYAIAERSDGKDSGHIMSSCDYIGLHVYEDFAFLRKDGGTKKLHDILELFHEFFPRKDWYITEYGINDTASVSQQTKGHRYAGMIHFNESDPPLPEQVKGAVYYHLATKGDNQPQPQPQPQYHIFPAGDEGYKQRTG